MNLFDFDKTIYDGDSSLDFWMFCIKKQPSCLSAFPTQLLGAMRYAVGLFDTGCFKQAFYRFLVHLVDVDSLIAQFWNEGRVKLLQDVLAWSNEGDLVVSASPEFLLDPICKKLGLRLIASQVSIETGDLLGPNCKGEEKVRRIACEGYAGPFERAYSDSLSDGPMLRLAEEGFIVKRLRPGVELIPIAHFDSISKRTQLVKEG